MSEQKTKILFAITKGVWGGAQKYVFELATGLEPEKYDISVVHGWGDTLSEKLTEREIPTFYIKNLGRDVNFLKDIFSFFSLLRIIKKTKPDIVHLNSSKIGGIGAIASRLVGVKKIIFTVHGFAFNENRSWIQKKIIALLSWLSIILCTDVIFISKVEMEKAIKWPFIKNKSHLVYNGIPDQKFQSREMARRFIAGIHGFSENIFENKTVIGTVAELTKNKGIHFAIEAIQNIPDCIYFIIGDGEEKEKLEKMIGALGLEQKVFLTGFVQNASQYLKAFDIFVLSSVKEGLPYVLLEAGLAELPVVASSVGGIPEIIKGNLSADEAECGILVEAGNIDQISKSLKKLVLEPQKRTLLGSNLRQKVQKDFSLPKMISETEKIYTK